MKNPAAVVTLEALSKLVIDLTRGTRIGLSSGASYRRLAFDLEEIRMYIHRDIGSLNQTFIIGLKNAKGEKKVGGHTPELIEWSDLTDVQKQNAYATIAVRLSEAGEMSNAPDGDTLFSWDDNKPMTLSKNKPKKPDRPDQYGYSDYSNYDRIADLVEETYG